MGVLEILIRKVSRPHIAVTDGNSLSPATSSGKNYRPHSMATTGNNACYPDFLKTRCEGGAKSKICNFLKIYFDFAFYSGFSPFHFVKDRDGWYSIKTWKPQQLLCALLHTVGVLRVITEVRGLIPYTVLQSPEHYFAIIGGTLRILFKVVAVKRFWWNQQQFLDILNFTVVEKRLPNGFSMLLNKYVISAFCGLCLIMPVVIGLNNNIIATSSTSNSTWWDRRLVSDGRFALFVISRTDYDSNGTTVIPDLDNISAFDHFLGVLMGLGLVERLIMGFYFDASLLCGVLTLWTTSFAFSSNLEKVFISYEKPWANCMTVDGTQDKSEKWVKLYETYKGIRTLSQLINNAFGTMITTFLAESILYHSMNMDAVIMTSDPFRQAFLAFFIVSSSLTFLYAADICSQMDSLKTWLSKDENRRGIPLDELNIVLHELQTHVIGIRGSNIFTITYSLVWNMLTTMVTYFIICVQARGNSGAR